MNIFKDFKEEYRLGGLVQKIIFWNVGIFVVLSLLDVVLKISGSEINYFDYVALPSNFNEFIFRFWTILTYIFIHADFWHLLFNVIVLWFSSRYFLYFFTTKQFSFVYFFGGIFAGLVFLICYQFLGINTKLVGASGSILAVLMAVTVYSPYTQVKLLLIGIVKLWHICFFILFLDLIQMPFVNFGGHLAHFGGAFFGFIYMKLLQNGTDLSKITTIINNFFQKKQSTPFKKVHVNPKNPAQNRPSKIVTKDKTQQQIDEILDKISQSGYDSLTAEEKEFLFRAGK